MLQNVSNDQDISQKQTIHDVDLQKPILNKQNSTDSDAKVDSVTGVKHIDTVHLNETSTKSNVNSSEQDMQQGLRYYIGDGI